MIKVPGAAEVIKVVEDTVAAAEVAASIKAAEVVLIKVAATIKAIEVVIDLLKVSCAIFLLH
jgi:hypothetical protein